VLIDEYDKPILDNLDNLKRAAENRDFLRGVYIQLKANDEFLRFAFLTGITKFSKASIFSGLNNIFDISLMRKFGNVCGYTQDELENCFSEYLINADKEKIKKWYNGYYFLKDRVYNPFDILKFFDNDYIFKSYWFESGSPYHLITLLKNQKFYLPELENVIVDDTILDTFDIEKIKLESLLFQAGYLTIKEVMQTPIIRKFKLGVPNLEVQISLNKLIFDYLTNEEIGNKDVEVYMALMDEDIDKFKEILVSLFAGIPYNNYVKNSIAHFEGYYASVVYAFLNASGLDIIAEDVTNKGRIDLSIIMDDKVYVIEFKVMENGKWKMENEGSEKCEALGQIKEKRYYEKYGDKKVYLIGICFSEEERNIIEFEWERVEL
ncbi:MAG: AAA family ATPase, partial [Epsilonproteobacteria bacterium]|nr:AAA family ATPase [Campylobacterota bacterium]